MHSWSLHCGSRCDSISTLTLTGAFIHWGVASSIIAARKSRMADLGTAVEGTLGLMGTLMYSGAGRTRCQCYHTNYQALTTPVEQPACRMLSRPLSSLRSFTASSSNDATDILK